MTNYYIWTEHLTDINNENITLLRYQTENNKNLSGIELIYEISGNNHPEWHTSSQFITYPINITSDITNWKYKIVEPSITDISKGKILLAGNTLTEISSNNIIGCLGIFKNTKFSITEIVSLSEGITSVTDNAIIQIPTNSTTISDISYNHIPIEKADIYRTYTEWKNSSAFVAIKSDYSGITWGNSNFGGDSPDISLININRIYSNYYSFAALKNDKSVITWGDPSYGGDSSDISNSLVNIISISSTEKAYAAINSNNNVISWGDSINGGNILPSISNELINVNQIYSNKYAFAALKNDKSVVTWGNSNYGGDSSSVTNQLINITKIFSTFYSFAALREDGNIITWGSNQYGAI